MSQIHCANSVSMSTLNITLRCITKFRILQKEKSVVALNYTTSKHTCVSAFCSAPLKRRNILGDPVGSWYNISWAVKICSEIIKERPKEIRSMYFANMITAGVLDPPGATKPAETMVIRFWPHSLSIVYQGLSQWQRTMQMQHFILIAWDFVQSYIKNDPRPRMCTQLAFEGLWCVKIITRLCFANIPNFFVMSTIIWIVNSSLFSLARFIFISPQGFINRHQLVTVIS